MSNIYESEFFAHMPNRSMHPGGLRLTDRAARLAALTEGMAAADIGCGAGTTAAYLTEKYKLKVVGVELSEELISIGLKSHPGLPLVRWDCGTLPFEPGSLDVIIFECSLSVIGHAAQVLAQCAEVLKASGTLIISDVCMKQSNKKLPDLLPTSDALVKLICDSGFYIKIIEDHTPALRTYIAELATLTGEVHCAGPFLGAQCTGAGYKLSNFCYSLIIAGKKQDERHRPLMKTTPLEKWIAEKIGISARPEVMLLQKYQLQKLRETLVQVKSNSRFYERHLSGIDPTKITSMQDVSTLPLTNPSDIADNPHDFLCVSPRDIGRIVTMSTSGTTGRPKRLFFTLEDQKLTIDFFHHGMTTLVDHSDKVIIFMPGGTEGSVGDLLKKGLAQFGCESIVYGPIKDYGHALKTLIDAKITCIVGIPSQVLALSRFEPGIETKKLMLKSVLLSADYVPLSTVSALEQTWGVLVYGHYGMTEMGLGGGVECAARNGYHLREADLLFEVIDPVSGNPVPDGSYGEVVFTTLTRVGMPLIRYRTGDAARFLTEPCPCGTVLRRLDRVTGRLDQSVRLSGDTAVSIAELDEVILTEPYISAYAADVYGDTSKDRLVITVRSSGEQVDCGELYKKIRTELPQLFSQDCLLLEVREGNVAFLTTGTLKRKIIDHRNHDKKDGDV